MHNKTLDQIINNKLILSSQIITGNSPQYILHDSKTNTIYVTNQGSHTVSVISTENNTKIKDIEVGKFPFFIIDKPGSYIIYITNRGSNTVSVISTENNTKIKDIEVGEDPVFMDIDYFSNILYVTNLLNDTVSVISTENNTKIKDIEVGDRPQRIEVGRKYVYVISSISPTVSVISTENNTKIKDIEVGQYPSDLDLDMETEFLYVTNRGSNTVSVISTENNTKIKDIEVGDSPIKIEEWFPNIYIINADSNTVSVISTENHTKIKDIEVGEDPSSMTSPYMKDPLYVTNADSNTVSVISTENNTKIKDIEVGDSPIKIEEWFPNIYIINADSNTVSVISTENHTKIKDIKVGKSPTFAYMDPDHRAIYIANQDSNSISLIDGISNKVVAGVTFNVQPFNSGFISCNNTNTPLNQYLYVDSLTECTAKPNKGFEFSNWIRTFENNSSQILKQINPVSSNPLKPFLDLFNIKLENEEESINITEFGTYTANFRELPPPLPPQYWATLFSVIVTAFISSWLTPTIIGWRKARKHQNKLNNFQKEIRNLYKDGKLDKNDIDDLDRLRNKVVSGYAKGDINKEQYDILISNISTLYNAIFKKYIDSLKNITNQEDKINLSNKIQIELDDAYLNEKIDKEYYNLLKEKIS